MAAPRRTASLVAAALAIVLAVALGSATSRGASSSGKVVDVYPIGGTTTANPSTTVSFRGATKLSHLSVSGSSTGHHSGHFLKHSDGRGVSFIPDRAFKNGELVTVHSSTPLKRATSAGNVHFRIFSKPNRKDLRNVERLHKDPEGTPKGAQAFHTRKDLRPPDLKVTTNDPAASSEPVFYAVKGGPGMDGPLIRDSQGRLIWFRRVRPPLSPYDFRTQIYKGKPVLTWWQGEVLGGKGSGYGVILDNHYRLIRHVSAGNGYRMDQHEFQLTPRGTAYINIYEPVKYSLRPIGGHRDDTVWDSIVQEIDIRTGAVLFEWHSLAHVSVRLGTFPLREGSGFPYDPFHVNSVSEDGNGNLLLSARNTNALFLIDRDGGKVLSRIGGKKSDFKMGPGTNMIGQHDARLQPDGTISVFDNGGSTQYPTTPDKPSRGIFLKIDGDSVSLVHQYHHNPQVFSRSQGSMQVLPNNDVFLSWGDGNPYLTEKTRDGHTVFESHIDPVQDDSYRAYRLPWSGATAENSPDAVAFSGKTGTNVYVSWNGATDVAEWIVQVGSDTKNLTGVAHSGWEDFETRIHVDGSPKYVRVKAVDAKGRMLGHTGYIKPKHV